MNKFVLLGAFFGIFVVGLVVILINHSVSFGDFMRSLEHMSPRVFSLLLLPFVAIVFLFGLRLHRKREERMWKKAMKDTRDKRTRQA